MESDAVETKQVADLAAISVQSRLLPFWRQVPRAWFVQFEAVVDPLKTSDDQKFRYVLQKLEPSDLQHVTDLLYDTPATDKYATIKRRPIKGGV
ncbi:jg15713 [Pararge aegeria aegeria]|uniref:Jg15713 protein n=1 Tax=Pararge aegeria aegeria TaxID=348720 RepID=A0A8S4SM83_9NEOP|nr:jg15713 [Pararge aegeria aegeria]